jgi:iron complex outermembrane receptor protein
MTYISVAEGFKAGSYQIAPVTPSEVVPVSPEKTINYELGTKVDFFDDRLYVDTDIYYIQIKDQQLQSILDEDGVLTSAITSASSSHVEGWEFSVAARPTDRVTLSGNTAYTLAEFDNYLISPEAGVLINRSGQPEPNTPLWTYFLSAAYDIPLDSHTLELSANYRYVDSITVGNGTGPSDPILPIPSWSELDVAGILHLNDWQIRLFCDNLTNRYIILNKNPPFTTPLNAYVHDIVAPPRRFGISASYQF